jgi:hypothetical protein
MREPALNPPLYSLFLLFQPPFPTIHPSSPTPTPLLLHCPLFSGSKNGQEKTRLMGGFGPIGFGMGGSVLLVEVSLIPAVLKSISKAFL